MRVRLFWKILLGFWLTFFFILEAAWVFIAFYRTPTTPPRVAALPNAITMTMTAAETAVRWGGIEALSEMLSVWPDVTRSRLRIEPPAGEAPQTPGLYVRDVADPGGAVHRLVYDVRDVSRHRGPFDIPPDILTIGAVGGLLFSIVLAWYLTRPIRRLRGGFERLAGGDLGARLAPSMGRRSDEIADLARDFDAMAARLQELVAARERLLHDVSHELRSPLARLHLAAELARHSPERIDDGLRRIEAEARRLDDLVGELLSLSRVEIGQDAEPDYFDPRELLLSVVSDARFEAQESGVAVAERIGPLPEPAPTVVGHAELLRRSLDNIVRNALRFAGGTVTVGLAADAARRVYVISVEDDGPGVAPDTLCRIFEPFVRGGGGQGYGLGLAIARRTIAAHGGEIAAANRPDGGLAVTITLPFGPAGE
ncbi:ATP-binding protein [Oleispirillum naphthae]|uniref:ATP-binding protein n=1 Tax=Oleispirillum naphthae TaxID=2838853 RepID=UPI00308232C5